MFNKKQILVSVFLLSLFLLPRIILAQLISAEKDIVLKTSSGTLDGTLIGNNTDVVAIIIAGSGPTDRYGNNVMGIKANSYKMLADVLYTNKITSLLYDKRGIGQSASAMIKEADLRFSDYIKDVSDWIALLKKDYLFKKVILIGHSEGALIASAVAKENPQVNGIVLLAGMGRDFSEVITEQLKRNPNNPQAVIDESSAILDSLKQGLLVKQIPNYFNSMYRASVQPYLISMLKYSPTQLVKSINIPLIIIQGDADKQVTVADAELLSSANPKAAKVIIQNMNHVLKTVKDDQDNQLSYTEPNRPLDAELIRYVIGFIKKI